MRGNTPGGVRGLPGRVWRLARTDSSILVGSVLTSNMLRILSSVILTRLLAPEHFGVMGVLVAVMAIFNLLTDLGFYEFAVRHKRLEEPEFLDRVWSLRLLRSIGLAVLIVLLAWPIAAGIGKQALWLAIAACSISVLCDGLSSMAFATGARNRQSVALAAMDVVPAVVQLCIAIPLAALLGNHWALVTAMLAGALAKLASSYTLFGRARRRFVLDREIAREVWRFGQPLMLSSVLTLVLTQADRILFSAIFTLETFGLYTIAATLATAPNALASSYSRRILYPAFARLLASGADGLRNGAYYSVGRPMRWLYMFAAGGFIATGPLIIHMLYRPAFYGAITFVQLLSVQLAFRVPILAGTQALMSLGHTRQTLHGNIARLLWLGTAGPALFFWKGPIGLVVALAGMEAVCQAFITWQLSRVGILRVREEATNYAVVIAGLAIGAAVNWVGLKFVS